jgi:predicted RNA methylase
MMGAVQHRITTAIKPLFFRDVTRPRSVKFGVGRGTVLLTNRRRGLQEELGLYETELSRVYRRHVGEYSVVYDIGAGNAREALIFARLGAAAVLAFDPDPGYARIARINLELNPQLAEHIRYFATAFVDVDPQWPVPTFAKIDVDGAEIEVLKRLPETTSAIVVETHGAGLEDECTELLQRRGYAVRLIRNAVWRKVYPEYGRLEVNRWLLGSRPDAG